MNRLVTFRARVLPRISAYLSSSSVDDLDLLFKTINKKKTEEELKPPAPEESDVVEGRVESFASLLRRSKLVQLGVPEGKKVFGIIDFVYENDLYIEFGGKFRCVCKRPAKHGEFYVKNAGVLLRLHDLELSSRFLGSDKDLTLLEADATLVGLANPPKDVPSESDSPRPRRKDDEKVEDVAFLWE